MSSYLSTVAAASVAESGSANKDRTSFSVEPTSPSHAGCSASSSSSPSSSSSLSSLHRSSGPAGATAAELGARSPPAFERQRFSDAVPCFASITLEDAAACEATPEADATAAERHYTRGRDFLGAEGEKGLLFLGTGASCALPQLAHVLPIADPSHPFHPFIHVPVEQLPSMATLHELAAASRRRQSEQSQRVENSPGDEQRNRTAATASPRRRHRHSECSASSSSHVGAEASGRPAEGGSRHTGHAGSEYVDTEVDAPVASQCPPDIREDLHTSAAASYRNKTDQACGDALGDPPCTTEGTSGVEGETSSEEGKCSTCESSNNSSRRERSNSRDDRRGRTGGTETMADGGHKPLPTCQFRCRAAECLQEELSPAPACVSCFMSWKSTRDPNNRGNVSAILKLEGGKAVLIDCGKTFRQAALAFCPRYGIRSLTAVLLTHDHQDAVGGLDDLRDMQRFCRPPYVKAPVAAGKGAAHTPAAANATRTEMGKAERLAGAAEKGEGVACEVQVPQQRLTPDLGELRRSRGQIHLAGRDIERKTASQPRDTLGYRPRYTLNCFLGARTYKTIRTRYGYIVDASSHMAAWVSAAQQQQQRQKLLQDARGKLETGAAAGQEDHVLERQERRKAGFSEAGASLGVSGRLAARGSENEGSERRTSSGKQVAEVDRLDVSVPPLEKKMRMQVEAEREEGNSSANAGDCESSGRDTLRQQLQAPMCFPCSPRDPGWGDAPVFERKVACLTFHLLSDDPPSSASAGYDCGGEAVCSSNTKSSWAEETRERSTASAPAGTEGAVRDQQENASALLTCCSKDATSATSNGNAASQATGKERVTEASLKNRWETASGALFAESTSGPPTAFRTVTAAQLKTESSCGKTALNNAGVLEGGGSGGNVAEKTRAQEGKSSLSASDAMPAYDPDAAGFCEARIPGTNTKLTSFPVFHGGTYVCLGYVIGTREKLLYMSDVKEVPPAVLERLKGIGDVHTLVIDALSEKLHNSHFSVQEALAIAVELQPREVYFVGMSCTLEHSQTNRRLRCWLRHHRETYRSFYGGRESRLSHVALAFDGLFLPIDF